MLDLEDDISVVAEAADGNLAVTLATSKRVDVAVLDLQMPGLDGIAVAERLAEQLPGCGCVIVTSHGRPGHLKRALAAGVRGFLPKTTSAVTSPRWSAPCTRAGDTSTPSWPPRPSPPATAR